MEKNKRKEKKSKKVKNKIENIWVWLKVEPNSLESGCGPDPAPIKCDFGS